ncbi:MAG: S46 family peptidase [bacterium]|nr:S46 family peptidase [bacterium]
MATKTKANDRDFAFFRVYENDESLNSDHFLKWNSQGAIEDELVFVSGNPGSTDRLYTFNELEMQQDFRFPFILDYNEHYIHSLKMYSVQGPEQRRIAPGMLFGLENAKKALTGEYEGLFNQDLMVKRKQQEIDFRRKHRKPSR